MFTIGSDRTGSDFVVNKRFILNHLQKTLGNHGADVATALRDKKAFDFTTCFPKVIKSQVDPAINKALYDEETAIYEKLLTSQINGYSKRIDSYASNCEKAYLIIWSQCKKAMQLKILAKSNYQADIHNKVIKLMIVIEELSICYEENKYEHAIIGDALRSLINIKQKDIEDLNDYTLRFTNMRDIFVSQLGGQMIFHTLVDTAANPSNMCLPIQQESWDQFLAYQYMERALPERYGSLMAGMATQKSLKNTQYPKTIEEAYAVLDSHPWDKRNKEVKAKPKQPDQKKNGNQSQTSQKTQKTDDNSIISEVTFAQLEGKCFCCGDTGHNSKSCPLKKLDQENSGLSMSARMLRRSKC